MNEIYILEQFEALGYVVQTPTDRDRNYFFAKQENNGSKFIWVKMMRTPEVCCKFNNEPSELTKIEDKLISDLVFSSGCEAYKLV